MVEDARYLVIDGRRWRRSDPAIPEALRSELVHELMNARRAVQAAKRADDVRAERAARARVQNAKVALGERGPRWWEPLDRTQLELRVRAAMRALLCSRGVDKSACPSDVARVVGQSSWRSLMPLVREVAIALCNEGELELRQRRIAVDCNAPLRGPLRLVQISRGAT
jgi:hypothetical protein